MNSTELKNRTKEFAKDVILLVDKMPNKRISNVISNQILRSATSVGANYRSACRARSKADFISKITIVEEEADETLYWLELIDELNLTDKDDLYKLMNETKELVAIFTATGKTTKLNIRNLKSEIRN
ncbi:MAG TPA: four helix bundle protein [Ignavibacteria bacterium]|nr:four helix bundle protein [Ignavibacteria bacterium]